MRLRVKKICIIFLIVLFIPQLLLADNHQLGNTKPTNVSTEDRTVWLARSKVFHNYKNKLDDIGGDLAEKAKDNQIYQDAGEYITDIAVVLGLLETVYTLDANCLQTHLTTRNLYKQILIAFSLTSNMTDYNKLKIDELYNKTKDNDALRLIGEGKVIIEKLHKALDDERKDIFSKLRKTKK